jgi:hypothetical protein
MHSQVLCWFHLLIGSEPAAIAEAPFPAVGSPLSSVSNSCSARLTCWDMDMKLYLCGGCILNTISVNLFMIRIGEKVICSTRHRAKTSGSNFLLHFHVVLRQ